MTGGLRARLSRRGAGLSDARWPDALAVCGAALPVTLLAALAVNYVWNLLPAPLDFYGVSDFYLPALALALPPLIALRYRRTAAVAALVAAALSASVGGSRDRQQRRRPKSRHTDGSAYADVYLHGPCTGR
jgi:membrane associated rhomboid family serine protease